MNADASQYSNSQENEKALAGCLEQIALLVALLRQQVLETRGRSEMPFIIESICQTRRNKCVDLFSALEKLVDEVGVGKIKKTTTTTKDREISSDMLRQMMDSLDLQEQEQETEESTEESTEEYKYVSAGIVIAQCKSFQRFEKELLAQDSNLALATITKHIASKMSMYKLMLLDAKSDLQEFITDPQSSLSMNDFDDFDNFSSSDDDDNDEQEADEYFDETGTPTAKTANLLTQAKLWSTKINLISVLFASVLKRRVVFDYTLSLFQSHNLESLALFLNAISTHASKTSEAIDDLASSILSGDMPSDLAKKKVLESSVGLAQVASETFQDEYCKWFVTWIDAFQKGL